MKTRIVTMFIVLFLSMDAYGAQSRILGALQKTVGKFLPSITEIGFVTNAINIYFQCGQLIRCTARIIESFKMVKASFVSLKEQAESTYDKLNDLTIDPYDMDTWAQTTNSILNINRYDRADLIHDFNMTEYYSVGGVERFLTDLEEVKAIGTRSASENIRKRAQTMNRYFIGDMSVYNNFYQTHREYKKSALNDLRSRYSQLTVQCMGGDTISCKESDKIQSEMAVLEEDVKLSNDKFQEEKILNQATVIMADNMSRMKAICNQVTTFEDKANELRLSWDKLKRGKITVDFRNVSENDIRNINQEQLYTSDNYDLSDPDKVPPPSDQSVKADTTAKSGSKLREVNQEDILALQNTIGYIEIRELALLRDLEVLKAQSIGYLIAMRSFSLDKRTEYIRETAVSSLQLSTQLEAK